MSGHEKFVVLGSCCFSGACFVDHILRDNPGAEVVGINRSPEYHEIFLPYRPIAGNRFRFHQMDLNRDLDEVVKVIYGFQPDYIVNFAAQGMVGQSWEHPEHWFRTNALAVVNLADRLKGMEGLRRYVQVSTPEIYGTSSRKMDEHTPLSPSSPYAASKAAGDLGLIPYFKIHEFPVVFTRASNVYGAHQQLYRVIPRTIINIKEGTRFPLHGSGRAVKPYIHIRDVCRATLLVARLGQNGEVYHISPDGEGISIFGLVEMICAKMGAKIEDCCALADERVGQDIVTALDSTKLRQAFGWRPSVELDAGVDEVIRWVEDHFDVIRQLPKEYTHRP